MFGACQGEVPWFSTQGDGGKIQNDKPKVQYDIQPPTYVAYFSYAIL